MDKCAEIDNFAAENNSDMTTDTKLAKELPEDFQRMMTEVLGKEEYDLLAEALAEDAPTSIRRNKKKTLSPNLKSQTSNLKPLIVSLARLACQETSNLKSPLLSLSK